jgi:hypothetical protein
MINNEFSLVNGPLKVRYLLQLDKALDDHNHHIFELESLQRKYTTKHQTSIIEYNKSRDQYNAKIKILYDLIAQYFSPNTMKYITSHLINDNYDQALDSLSNIILQGTAMDMAHLTRVLE